MKIESMYKEIHDLTDDSKTCYDMQDYDGAYNNIIDLFLMAQELEEKIKNEK